MSTTVKLVQLSHHKRKDGTYPILFRITEDRKIRYKKTGFAVLKKQFRDIHEHWVHRHSDSEIYNAAISKQWKELLSKVYLSNETKETFYGAILKKLTQLEVTNKVAAYNRLLTNQDYIKESWGKDVPLNKITKDLVEKYVNKRYENGNKESTIKKNLEDLAGVLDYVEWGGVNEFAKYAKTVKPKPADREKLLPDEIALLENNQFTENMELAVDMYLFSYYLHGARFESIATFNKADIGKTFIKYRMNKGQKVREIEIHPKLRRIIEKYINQKNIYLFPAVKQQVSDIWRKKEIIGSANANMSKYLKMAALKVGITKKISYHVARHSFATNIDRLGVDMHVIKEALGHSKISTTEKYIKSLSDDLVNKSVNKLYE